MEAYADVFGNGDNYVVWTDVIEHCIPLMDGTKLNGQPPRRLGAEGSWNMGHNETNLTHRGMVEPADGMWSSLVVLVCKKEYLWRLFAKYHRLKAVTRR